MADIRQVYGAVARDPRVDFFRGIALLMIFVDHVIDDPISRFTFQHFGFSDAAEIFVFLSGVSCGAVYSGLLERRGFRALITAITKRARLIYVYYVLSSIIIIVLVKATASLVIKAGAQPLFFISEEPKSTLWSIILLMPPPVLPSILALYISLTLIVIPLFLIGARRNAVLTLAVSGLIWTISQIVTQPWLVDYWYFNPLAWQFMFSIGMFVGTRCDLNWKGLRSAQLFAWLVKVAWTIVLISFLYKFLKFFSPRLNMDFAWLQMSPSTMHHMKQNLNIVRLLHFLAVAFLVKTYIESINFIFKWPAAVAISRVGSRSLEIFSMGAILSTAFSIIFVVNHPSIFGKLILDFIAMLLMGLTACSLCQQRAGSRIYRPG